jgi:hypothetical protein
LWKAHCINLWKDKGGMFLLRKEKSVAPFWRSYVTSRVVEKMSVKDIKGMFAERPLGRLQARDLFVKPPNHRWSIGIQSLRFIMPPFLTYNGVIKLKIACCIASFCLEKEDMQQAIMERMPKSGELGSPAVLARNEGVMNRRLTLPIDHLWFGSFLSSVVDSRRSVMLLDELISRKGFMMYLKKGPNYQDYNAVDENAENSLRYYGKCVFNKEDSGNSVCEMSDPLGPCGYIFTRPWRWIIPGQKVQYSSYTLVIHRLDDWGWQLESSHMVLLSQ